MTPWQARIAIMGKELDLRG